MNTVFRSTDNRDDRLVMAENDWNKFVQVLTLTNPGSLMIFGLLQRVENEELTIYLQPETITGVAAALWKAQIPFRQKGIIPVWEAENEVPDVFLNAFGIETKEQDIDEDGLVEVKPFDPETVSAYVVMVSVEATHKGQVLDVDRHSMVARMSGDYPENIPFTVTRAVELPDKPEHFDDFYEAMADPMAELIADPYLSVDFDTDNTGGPLMGWTANYSFDCPNEGCIHDWYMKVTVFAKKSDEDEIKRNRVEG